MLKSPSKQEKKSSRSLRKLMKRKLSFKTKDRTDNEDFGDTHKWKFGRKNKLPPGIPTEIVFNITESEDYDDYFSNDSHSKGIPELISAETPIKRGLPPPSESRSPETLQTQPSVSLQSLSSQFQTLPDRFQSLQNILFTNRKSLLAVAAAALVCTQVPETTKLQLSVFAAGLSSTILEQSKTLITNNLPNTTENIKNPNTIDNSEKRKLKRGLVRAKLSRVVPKQFKKSIQQQQENVSDDHENRPIDYAINAASVPDSMRQAVPAETSQGIISSPSATLQADDDDVALDHFHSGAQDASIDMVTSQPQGSMKQNGESFIVVQSNIVVDNAKTIIVQNNIVVSEGNKGTIIIQSNIGVPEGRKALNTEIGQVGVSIQEGSNYHLGEMALGTITNTLEHEELGQMVPKETVPAADELPPECYNVFKKFFNKDCRAGEKESKANKERNWIESLMIDDWILHMDL